MSGTWGTDSAGLGSALAEQLAQTLLALALIAVLTAVALRWAPAGWRTGRMLGWFDRGTTESRPLRVLRIGLGVLWIVDGLLQAQPRMPAGFITQVIEPGLSSAPAWLTSLADPLLQAWTAHPVLADTATVWIQIGLGVLILLGGRGGSLDRSVLLASIFWCTVVWVVGEGFGGLFAPGASWLAGSPGAVLAYAGMAWIVLIGQARSAERAARLCRWAGAVWLLVGAVLQAVPWEQNWQGDGLTAGMQDAERTAQPAVMITPIRATARVLIAHPGWGNLVLAGLLVALGAALLTTSSRFVVGAAITFCLATWWLGQDFGVLGGIGTDPNAALPLAVLLLAGLPPLPASGAESAAVPRATQPMLPSRSGSLRLGLAAAAAAAVLAVPLVIAVAVLRPADASAVTADSQGGLRSLPVVAAPSFHLTDQQGQVITMAQLRGKVVLVTFLDPECSDDCPIIANQIAMAVRSLGVQAANVAVLAVDSNPLFNRVSDVAAFTETHGLHDLTGWHFVCGDEESTRRLLGSYGVTVTVPEVGMVAHSEGIYFLDRSGAQRSYLSDGANARLTTPYTLLIRTELLRLLG